MQQVQLVTALIRREGEMYVALCPELDIASQGDTVEHARENLIEALELFYETADPSEIAALLHHETYISSIEIRLG